jgi:cyclohexa-1,5-dienecarbonyl-CoA hydratase
MISAEKKERVLQLKIDVPPVNVIDTKTCKELARHLNEAAQDATLAGVVVSGEGKCFSAGASVEEHRREHAREMITAFTDACRALYRIPVPTVALIHGFCFGGGFELTMYCDYLVADPSAKFGVPEVKLAFFPPFACSVLSEIVGRQNAQYLIYTGESISVEQAVRMGLVQKVSPQNEWDQVIKQLNGSSVPVLRLAKKAFKSGEKLSVEEAFDSIVNDLFLNELYQIEDVAEGIASFNEKRKPQWKHE